MDRASPGDRAALPFAWIPKILESYVGQYQFETLENRIFTVTREG